MRVSGVRPPVRHRPASAPLTRRMRGIASLCVGDHDPARVCGVTRVVRTRSSVFRSVHEPFGDVRERERTLAEPPFFRRPGTPRYPLGVRGWPPFRHRWVLLPKNEAGLGSIRDQSTSTRFEMFANRSVAFANAGERLSPGPPSHPPPGAH